MGPGGQYGNCWWERDSSLTLNGYCWLDQKFSENALYNFTLVQKENGRIPLWGNDRVGDLDEQLSAIPVIFDVAYRICKRTTDKAYIVSIYDMLRSYLHWWLSDIKRDKRTGLVCGIMEESDPSDYTEQLTFAPVDLNVQICCGADILSKFAEYLNIKEDVIKYKKIYFELCDIINEYLFDKEDGFYYTRNVKENRLLKNRPYSSAFDTFRHGIIPADRIPLLLSVLKDNSKYGYYDKYGITTAPYDSPEFCETVGDYKGWTSWSGNIWTFRNEIIAQGLRDCGLYEEAAHIAYQTVMTFNGNYAEFINPSTGAGQGVKRYGWSASQYIELITEVIFGVDYNAWENKVTVCPCIPEELFGGKISISDLSLVDAGSLSVSIECGKERKVSYVIK
ncbi:MAG: hypothetical protein II777_05320 [Clostridia bacterium]|nr:hypothetical protein [Clostridia bacterium]